MYFDVNLLKQNKQRISCYLYKYNMGCVFQIVLLGLDSNKVSSCLKIKTFFYLFEGQVLLHKVLCFYNSVLNSR